MLERERETDRRVRNNHESDWSEAAGMSARGEIQKQRTEGGEDEIWCKKKTRISTYTYNSTFNPSTS